MMHEDQFLLTAFRANREVLPTIANDLLAFWEKSGSKSFLRFLVNYRIVTPVVEHLIRELSQGRGDITWLDLFERMDWDAAQRFVAKRRSLLEQFSEVSRDPSSESVGDPLRLFPPTGWNTLPSLPANGRELPFGTAIGGYLVASTQQLSPGRASYLARHSTTNREVSLEVLSHWSVADLDQEALLREVRRNRALRSSVVSVFLDVFIWEDRLVLASAAPEGPTLRSLRSRKKVFSFEETLNICFNLATVLDSAERLGLWHGALSPDSVTLNSQEVAFLGQLGLGMAVKMLNKGHGGFSVRHYDPQLGFPTRQFRNEEEFDRYRFGQLFCWMLLDSPVIRNSRWDEAANVALLQKRSPEIGELLADFANSLFEARSPHRTRNWTDTIDQLSALQQEGR